MAGRLSEIAIFPLKSAGPIPLLGGRVTPTGLAGDRIAMVVDQAGNCLTSRDEPRLLRIKVQRDGESLILVAPEMEPLLIQASEDRLEGKLWGQQVGVLGAGAEAMDWVSKYLNRPARLVWQDAARPRPSGLAEGRAVSLADTAPLLLIGAASLDALNGFMDQPVPMARFRPNVVIADVPPFAEDGWAQIRIGAVTFAVVGPCDRCVVTTLDPARGARDGSEPLTTLNRVRRGPDGKVYFGQFLVPLTEGRIYIDDRVEVLWVREPFLPAPAPTKRLVAVSPVPSAGSTDSLTLTCVAVIPETPDFTTFRFATSAPVSYRPGQFLPIRPQIDGETLRRTYTISSSPSRPGHIAITVKRVAGGRVSNWLHDTMVPGMQLQAGHPGGRFHLGRVEEGPGVFMVSAGSGITPMIAMLRFIADHALPIDVHFHHSCRRPEDMAFRDELARLERELAPRLVVTWNLTAAGLGAGAGAVLGRLDSDMLAAIAPDLSARTVLCCGPTPFRQTLRDLLIDAGHDVKTRYFEESFGAGSDAEVAPIASYDVTFSPAGKHISGEGNTTVLAAARHAGLAIPTECEAGICGSCRCTIVKGNWQLAAHCADPERNTLSDQEKASGVVLACTTSPIGAVEVVLE